jgi:hypothetical protein
LVTVLFFLSAVAIVKRVMTLPPTPATMQSEYVTCRGINVIECNLAIFN